MFEAIQVSEPLERIAEDWDFLAERVLPHFSTFKPVGQNIYGMRRRHIGPVGVTDLKKGAITAHYEMGPSGLVHWEHKPFQLHITTAGTPHHVSHNFGYWHINDMDEMYLPMPGAQPDELGYFILLMGAPRAGECDRFAWYCQQCLTLMHEFVYRTGDEGFNGFWKAERTAVNEYNSDPAHRRCPECGALNPPGYCWQFNKDSALEREGRTAW
ncbi:MAG TPA: hypothetical protein VK066_24800 [Chloroflexota bacterium]|nr:hypothetical protein [Chloroflexota bacterium]